MISRANARFWKSYKLLPPEVQLRARKNYALFKRDPHHPSLQFKKVGPLWSARVGRNHRALAMDDPQGLVWIWIGPHDEYNRLIR